MDSYIIRIYRRDLDASGKMLGVVTEIKGYDDQPFSSSEELWNILKEEQKSVDESDGH